MYWHLLCFQEEDLKEEYSIEDSLNRKLLDYVKTSTPHSKNNTPYSTPPGTPEKHINPERDNYNVDKITECWKCGDNFLSRKSVLRHLKEHNIDLPFKCYLCDASFDNRKDCLQHKTKKHPQDWVLLKEKNKVNNVEEYAQCINSIVEQNFTNTGNNGEGRFTEKELSHLNLTEDLKPESDYLQRKVYCALCPKRFWSLQDLRRHMRSHTG